MKPLTVEATPGTAPAPAERPVRGDLLVAFGEVAPRLPGRAASAAWSTEASGATWTLRSQDRSPEWCGYPLEVVESGPWKLWLLGEFAGAQAVARDVVVGVATGARSAMDLDGHLLLLGWNARERQWHAWTDRFGTVHAYFASDGSRAALGTFFPAVAAATSRRRLDWQGLAGFFAFGFFPQDRTFFDDVRILRPGSHHVFDEAGRRVREERWFAWRHAPDFRRSYTETVDEFAAIFHEVLDGQSHGRIAVPISGGLDSRSTVAALTRAGRPADAGALWSYSYGYAADSVETRIARQVAAARRLPFEARTIGPYLFDRMGTILSCVEGFQDVTQSRQATVSGMLARDADAVIAAHWGDVWLDDMGLEGRGPVDDAGVLDHAFGKIAKRGRRWLLDHLAAPQLGGAAAEPLLKEMIGGELSRVGAIEDPDFRVKAFKTEQWSFRWTLASIRMYQAGALPRLPFYDTRLSDFFATVPSAMVRGRRLQIDYLKRFAPDLARIKWQAFDTNLYRYPHFDTWLLPSRAVKKVLRALKGTPAPQRNWEVQLLSAGGRRALEETLLGPGAKLSELVAAAQVRSLIERFYAAPLEDGRGYTVSMLLTLSAWLEAHG